VVSSGDRFGVWDVSFGSGWRRGSGSEAEEQCLLKVRGRSGEWEWRKRAHDLIKAMDGWLSDAVLRRSCPPVSAESH